MEYQLSKEMFPTLQYHLTSLATQPAAAVLMGRDPLARVWVVRDAGMPTFNARPGAREGSDLSEGCSVSQQLGPAALRVLGMGPRSRAAGLGL